METSEGRRIRKSLRTVLTVDTYLTDAFVNLVEKFLPLRQLEIHYKFLELSCHGIPWLTTILIFIQILDNKSLFQMQVNLMIGLLIDILLVCILKAIIRRRRPSLDNNLFFIGPDKYSFPSGHASRAVFITYFFFYIWPISLIFASPILAWSVSVCLSRLLLRRHHILDVLFGILLGILEGLIVSYIYLEQETCLNLISWISKDM
ncbi:phospholipid phosphatase 6-like [Odontomachus brunneus]|uniref:phospholipid phosphatase 6-like n=1 Tax=Odontomachus brunneus TaxID=486640 RepID=UPI0013F28EC1|nr:phospholipid phosphatase 6-like [Odontomachus brunneus]XP_032674913.1 phospholipid phosphatase 6-like [Odontomachus brunneus]